MVFMDSELAFICGIHWSGSRLIRNSKLVGVRFWKDVLEKGKMFGFCFQVRGGQWLRGVTCEEPQS